MKYIYFYMIILFSFLLFKEEKIQAGIFTRKIDSIQIEFDKNQLVLPGESFKIGVISYHKNGKIKRTWGMKGGSVLWWRYKTEVAGGQISGGKITVNKQLMPSKGKFISVKIAPRKQPELAKTLLIALNYETQIKFNPISDFDKAPGCSFMGEIIARFDNGSIRKTKVTKYLMETGSYRFYANGLILNKGKFTIEPDFERITDHQVLLMVKSNRNPEISATHNILLDYKHNYQLSFSGFSGISGFNGFRGSDGSNGENGSDGGNGENGSPGYDGPDIGVWSDLYFDSLLNCNLLYVIAENFSTGEKFKYLVNPEGGNISVSSYGGSGGNGGDGGRGGDGGNGADGRVWYETRIEKRIVRKPFTEQRTKKVKKIITDENGNPKEVEEEVTENITVYRDVEEEYEVQIKHQDPGENGGHGGWGGDGGLGGLGGWGGNIYLYFTDDAQNYSNIVVAKSIGGSGGLHGSGGRGGSGGIGGSGNPNGRNGFSGDNGSEAIGWAGSGSEGEIFLSTTEEFIYYDSALSDMDSEPVDGNGR